MIFIKQLLCILLLILLFACSQKPLSQSEDALEKTVAKQQTSKAILVENVNEQQVQASVNQYLQQAVQVSESVKKTFAQAKDLYQQKQYAQAEKILNKLAKENKNLSGIWLYLGLIAEQQDQLDLAQSHYTQAININELNYFAHNNLAMLYRQQGKFELAEEHYKQALASWPACPEANLNLGILLDLYLARKSEAVKYYELYLQYGDSSDRKVKGWLADLKRQIGKDKDDG